MFTAPASPPQPQQPQPPQQDLRFFDPAPQQKKDAPGDFTSFFQRGPMSSAPDPAAPTPQVPLAYSDRPGLPMAPPPPPPPSPGYFGSSSEATGVFQQPSSSGAFGSAPGEYTRMFQSQSAPPSMQPLPQQAVQPAVAPAGKDNTKLILIVLLAVIALVLVGLVLYFVFASK
jgi:hypothetical protein